MANTWLRVLLGLSLTGVVLLPLFGLVLHMQPQLVHGLHVEPRNAERNCYLAAGCYGAMLLLSAAALCVKKRQEDAATRRAVTAATVSEALAQTHMKPRYSASSSSSSTDMSTPARRSLTPYEKKRIAEALASESTHRRSSGDTWPSASDIDSFDAL